MSGIIPSSHAHPKSKGENGPHSPALACPQTNYSSGVKKNKTVFMTRKHGRRPPAPLLPDDHGRRPVLTLPAEPKKPVVSFPIIFPSKGQKHKKTAKHQESECKQKKTDSTTTVVGDSHKKTMKHYKKQKRRVTFSSEVITPTPNLLRKTPYHR